MKNQLLTILLVFISLTTWAQNGIVTGVVNDGELNDVLPFADVVVKGTGKGVTTDFDGKYSIELEPGTYTLLFSFVGYQTKEITDVKVEANKDVIVDVVLNVAEGQLDEIIITTTARRNTESSVLNLQKKSVNLFDGLSLEGVKKTGASNIASAVKSVPGVSLQGGKFVYVRGLGDRYTKSTLNGMDIPGLNPDRNTVQLDIFPTNLIENVIVYKALTADLPADFTGGAVDIVTKDFSSREEYNFSFGSAYNPSMHFNGDFIQEDGSGTDFLGFDDGLRSDPFSLGVNTPQPNQNDPRTTDITREFNPTMAGEESMSFMNFNIGFSTSNQFNVGDNKLGYNASLAYRSEVTHYNDFTQNFLFKPQELDDFELIPNRLQEGRLSKQNTLISGLAGLTYKTDYSKYKLIFMRIQNGEKRAGEFDQESFITNAATFVSENLEYTESSISNVLLSGEHSFSQESNLLMDWKVNAALSSVDDKDVRSTLFEVDDGQFIIRPSIGEPRRIWRDLDETNFSSKLNFDYNHNLFNNAAKLKFGGAQVYKQRDFTINQYVIRIDGTPAEGFNGDPNRLLIGGNLWTPNNSGGTYVFNTFEPANLFESYSSVYAAYASEEFKISEKLKSILGLRFEKYDLFYTGQNTIGDINLDNENILDEADFFPSANLIYALNDNTNLRLSYARSTARPSFKEASIAQIFDPITNITFNGNLDLKPTYVNNFDIRYELFGDDGGLLAFSVFYKDFKDPIELAIFGIEAINDVQPRNLGEAQVFGVEVEFRKNLGFISSSLEKLSLNTNVSIIQSEQQMNEAEFEARQMSARVGENIDNKRQLQGQSPYLVNAGLTYDDADKGLQAGFYYNVQGETLQIVGIGQVADVYSDPFHSLNFNASKKFGEDQNQTFTLGVDNLLNDEVQSFYQSFNAEDALFSNYSPGIEISLKYSYTF
ncbi:TonB-dependent receptor [Psychroflexus planctonicus]|uniref:Outer membrane protein n=1 Tax=Psychroflexus planctonicus TaxID=1526575 RepID=A0ABQ1SHR9_9FLAO|nr:TonB-dependent receptor [Psychroflexus planctonicus]GGE36917.1 outer membrane protein [Psychroflexus planctonicus]